MFSNETDDLQTPTKSQPRATVNTDEVEETDCFGCLVPSYKDLKLSTQKNPFLTDFFKRLETTNSKKKKTMK